MNQARDTNLRANSIHVGTDLLPQLIFFPYAYKSLADAKADVRNLRVIVHMHGIGEVGTGLDDLFQNAYVTYLATDYYLQGYIILCPQLQSGSWTSTNMTRVVDMLDIEYPNALSYDIVGHSLGGMGCYNLLKAYPSRWNTCAPVSGNDSQNSGNETININAKAAVRHWHGTADGVVTYASAVASIDAFGTSGYVQEHTLISLTGLGHDIDDEVNVDPDYYSPWLVSKRDEEPQVVITADHEIDPEETTTTLSATGSSSTKGAIQSYLWEQTFYTNSAATIVSPTSISTSITNMGRGKNTFRVGVEDIHGIVSYKYVNVYRYPVADGIMHSRSDVTEWRRRISVGRPFVSKGTEFKNSGAAWDDVVVRANKFINNQVTDYWDGDFVNDDPSAASNGHYIMACAFYYLITGDETHGNKAKNAIIAQANNTTNPDFEAGAGYPIHSDTFHFVGYCNRLMVSYDYVKDLFTAGELAIWDTWITRHYLWNYDIQAYYHYAQFPNSDSGDWDTRLNDALTEVALGYGTAKERTYCDGTGTYHNTILKINHWEYQNGPSDRYFSQMLYGVYKNDTTILNRIKNYVKEVLMFAIYPDGSFSEACRNGEYSRESQGTMNYGSITWQNVFMIADIFRRRGDTELYEFTTSYGIGDSIGGAKNLKLVLDTYITMMIKEADWYYNTPSTENRLATKDISLNYRYDIEHMFMIANLYYKDARYREIYMLRDKRENPYLDNEDRFNWVPNSEWCGAAHNVPALPLQYGLMEGIEDINGIKYNKNLLS